MTHPSKITNPTLKASDFAIGDFAEWELFENTAYAIITRIDGEKIYAAHFEDGLGFETDHMPKYGGARKATKEEALAHFESLSDRFESKVTEGGLEGAIAARKLFNLTHLITALKAEGVKPIEAIRQAGCKAPGTGVYVLMGIYSGQGPSEHLEGLIAQPRLTEEGVSRVMKLIKPGGFGSIPSDVYNTPATSHGSLVTYWAFEVPERARAMVPTSIKLEDNGAEWKYSEMYPKK